MMKLKIIIITLLLGMVMTDKAITPASKVIISRIEPTNWYVGMKDTSLQLMVYGPGIGKADVSTAYEGVRIDSVVRLDSPHYLLVYLNLRGAKPGTMMLNFTNKGHTKSIPYELKKRAMKGEDRIGFNNSDVLYMLMPDRFANGNLSNDVIVGMRDELCNRQEPSLRHGGDLEGIRQHLDYFTQLGVTALWLTPVLENDLPADKGKFSCYHGYATTDYYRVDPRLGTLEEYQKLIADAHKRGLKVVMDMIFNHCGYNHPWIHNIPNHDWFNSASWLNNRQKSGKDEAEVTDLNTATRSSYLQTSYKLTPVLDPYASEIDYHETVDGWFVPSMPDLNQRNPYVMKYLIQNSEWWIETVGIDGIRMDTYPYADRDAMARWMKIINTEYPNFNTVGESWVTEPAYTAALQKDSKLTTKNSNLKTVMDFAFFDRLNLAKHEETDEWWKGLNRIYNVLCYDYLYADPSHVMAFIDNHDTDRFLGNGKDSTALKQALALLLTINRIPQLYYGTEVLMNGTKEVTDGNVRRDFPGGWSGDKHNCFTPQGRTKAENSMFDWLSRLLHWRQGNKVIRMGRQTQFIPYKGIYVVARQHEGRTVLTVLNGLRSATVMPVERYAEVIGAANQATDILTGRKIDLSRNITLSPREALILEF